MFTSLKIKIEKYCIFTIIVLNLFQYLIAFVKLQCHDLKQCQQELDHSKNDVSSLETKMKWLQNNLKNEIDIRKVSIFNLQFFNSTEATKRSYISHACTLTITIQIHFDLLF